MTIELTTEHETRIRFHLGYPITGTSAASISIGLVRPMQTAFMLDNALQLVRTEEEAVRIIIDLIARADCAMDLWLKSGGDMRVAKVGNIEMRGAKKGERTNDLLRDAYVDVVQVLADTLGVPIYLYSKRFRGRTTGAVPVRRR